MSSFWSKPFRNILGSKASEAVTGVIDDGLNALGLDKYKDLIEFVAIAYVTGGGNIPLPGGGTWNIGQLGVNVSGNDVVQFFKTNKGSIIKSAVIGQVTGGDPKIAGMLGGVIGQLGQLPGGIGKFFNSDMGKSLLGMFIGSGGNKGVFDGLGSLGGSLGDVATFMALAYAGKEFAKESISRANELNDKEYSTITQLVDSAQQFSKPEYKEAVIQKSLEAVDREAQAAKQGAEQNLFARGLGNRTPGAVARIGSDTAQTRAETRRNLGIQLPQAATSMLAAAAGPLSSAADRAAKTAAEESRMPLDFYMAMNAANKVSPMDEYYKNLNQQQQQQQGTNNTNDLLAGIANIGNILAGATGSAGTSAATGATAATGLMNSGFNAGQNYVSGVNLMPQPQAQVSPIYNPYANPLAWLQKG